ncbi:MAG: hypothetical protein R2911_01240 [Caldilineaceae bacterium]
MRQPYRSCTLEKLIAVLMLLSATLSGCMLQTTPPGPNAVSGAVDGGGYLLLQWPAGLTIMIWDDIHGSHENSGGGSTSDPVFHQQGYAEAADGRHYAYTVETRDGKVGELRIDNQPYDLAQGALFLVQTRGGHTTVQQLTHDLSAIEPTNAGCEAFGQRDTVVAEFIRQAQAAE